MNWKTEDLLDLHEAMGTSAREIMKAKNHDYAGKSGDTPFANFMASESVVEVPAELGLEIRIVDKLRRLTTFVKTGDLKVLGEGPLDACMDVQNYAVLLYGLICDKRGVSPESALNAVRALSPKPKTEEAPPPGSTDYYPRAYSYAGGYLVYLSEREDERAYLFYPNDTRGEVLNKRDTVEWANQYHPRVFGKEEQDAITQAHRFFAIQKE